MSYHVVRWVLGRSPVAVASERFVLVVLAEHAGHDGWDARPSVATIASETGYSERQVQRALGALQKAGAIEQTGVHPSGVRIWRVLMDRESFEAANWSAEQEAYAETAAKRTPENGEAFYRKPGGDTASPRRQDVTEGATQRHPNHPNRPDDLPSPRVSGDSDDWGDTASPPGRHSVTPRIATAWQQAKTSLGDESRSAAATGVYVEPLKLVSGDERHVVLETLPAAVSRTRSEWIGPISDAFFEVSGLRPNIHVVAAPEDDPLTFASPAPSGATRTLAVDEVGASASTGRPDAEASMSVDAPPERENP